MISAWRIVKTIYSETAFSGDSAKEFGGRWNNKGTSLVYLADSLALCALEIFVHMPTEHRNIKYVCFRVEIPEKIVKILDVRNLPSNWRQYPALGETMKIGIDWVVRGRSAVLKVPSAIIPQESNYLLNPNHLGFKKIKIHDPEPFSLDPRMWK